MHRWQWTWFALVMVACTSSAPEVASLTLAPSSLVLEIGQKTTLGVTLKDASGNVVTRPVTWSSSDPAIALVDASSGEVTAVVQGGATITAQFLGVRGSASITVVPVTQPKDRQTQQSLLSTNANGTQTRVRFWQYLPNSYASSNATYPLLIFLHGAGETSKDDAPSADATEYPRVLVHGPPKLVKNNNADLCFTVAGTRSCFILLSPQAPKADGWWNVSRIRALLDHAKANLRVDPKRVYLTGLSMGGGGTWNFAASKTDNPTRLFANELAAIVPIAGAASPSSATCNLATAALPVWAFHGTADTVVSPQSSRDFVNLLNGVKVGSLQCASSSAPALLTEYAGVGHDSWTRTYDPANRFDSQTTQPTPNGVNIYEWLLTKTR
jgi:predicted peptidase